MISLPVGFDHRGRYDDHARSAWCVAIVLKGAKIRGRTEGSGGSPLLYTIGHSNHSLAVFLALLRNASVEAVADVRSAPFSRFNPQFNKQALSKSLRDSGLIYRYMGRLLGGRPRDPECFVNGRLDPLKATQTTEFRQGIEQLLKEGCKNRVAIMCAERNPDRCHRASLITPALLRGGAGVMHILANGSLVRAPRVLPIESPIIQDLFDDL